MLSLDMQFCAEKHQMMNSPNHSIQLPPEHGLKSSYEGDGVQFSVKCFGSCVIDQLPDDCVCKDSMRLLKQHLTTNRLHKEPVTLYIQWHQIRVVKSKTNLELHCHPTENVLFVWLDPNDSKSFGLAVKLLDNDNSNQKFYAYKVKKQAITIINALKTLYELKAQSFLMTAQIPKESSQLQQATTAAASENMFQNNNEGERKLEQPSINVNSLEEMLPPVGQQTSNFTCDPWTGKSIQTTLFDNTDPFSQPSFSADLEEIWKGPRDAFTEIVKINFPPLPVLPMPPVLSAVHYSLNPFLNPPLHTTVEFTTSSSSPNDQPSSAVTTTRQTAAKTVSNDPFGDLIPIELLSLNKQSHTNSFVPEIPKRQSLNDLKRSQLNAFM